jgi:hypothetical protein
MATGTITPTPTTSSSSANSGLMSEISQHKGVVIGGALVLGIGIYFLVHRNKSSSTGTSTSVTTTGTTQVLVPAGVAGSQQTNNAVLAALQTMQATTSAQLAAQQTAIEKAIDTLIAKKNPGNATAATTGSSGHTTSGGSSTPVNKGKYQVAPTYNIFGYNGATYVPVTVFKVTGTVYFKTTTTGAAIKQSVVTARKIEHTGTRKFPQYTTYSRIT